MMDDTITYMLHLLGQINEREINALSPLQIQIERVDAHQTLVSVCTDQSGIIGLIRHLHSLGLVFLSVRRSDAEWACAHPPDA